MPLVHRRRAFIALLISVPCTSIGAILLLLIAPGAIGKTILTLIQIWLLVLPIAWLYWVERKSIKISPPKRRDWMSGAIIGLLMFSIILLAYFFLVRHWINPIELRHKIQQFGMVKPLFFHLSGLYVILVNAMVEEYFWRWFVYRRCEELFPVKLAIPLSALFFTLHHTIGLAILTDWKLATLGSIGVFAAGVIWSACYRRYRSLWSNYFSHAMADLALHLATWHILFG
jgi:uncharacterized protein